MLKSSATIGGDVIRDKLPAMQIKLSVDAAYFAKLPSEIRCKKCGEPLLAITKLPTEMKVIVDVRFNKPPEILNAGLNKGRCRCDHCGTKNPIDLRLFRTRAHTTR